ncbi:MAG: hypothetical protein Q8O88_00955 [bacterium]|nr:hypothetical protein [bacterium]
MKKPLLEFVEQLKNATKKNLTQINESKTKISFENDILEYQLILLK